VSLRQSLTLTHAWDLTVDTASVLAHVEASHEDDDSEPPQRPRRHLWRELRGLTTGMSACALVAQL